MISGGTPEVPDAQQDISPPSFSTKDSSFSFFKSRAAVACVLTLAGVTVIILAVGIMIFIRHRRSRNSKRRGQFDIDAVTFTSEEVCNESRGGSPKSNGQQSTLGHIIVSTVPSNSGMESGEQQSNHSCCAQLEPPPYDDSQIPRAV
ncbi:hypothetical protein SCHPADRAFT_55206 [Schizopora paradoxa]|uniref:Uncharacterized protein n=1 Tax=Schizopora paradoxa TaxID=27342 RepID=A0A0H2S644_9AGAM|nr:hypothetical protein SCHPADRAFT_55206 [Schizopora paradoxa]